MASNVVTVSGMFGTGHTYFADSPVVIDISGLQWPGTSPFNIVRVEVVYEGTVVGDFKDDTGGQPSMSLDISSALRAIWSEYDYGAAGKEVAAADAALAATGQPAGQPAERDMRPYFLRIYTEYLSSDDGGRFTVTRCEDGQGNTDIPGGQCLMGGMTEWERSLIDDPADRDVSHFEHTGVRNGDASTKPTSSPERVGSDSITSWVDVGEKKVNDVDVGYTKSIFYPAGATPGDDDVADLEQGWTGHAPIVLRDSQPYVDFLFTNRRGAVETCSALMKEAMDIGGDMKQYSRTDGPAFRPQRSLMAIGTDGRRSWQMSSGYVTREWAEWWTAEFLYGRRKQWWMRYRYADGGVQRQKFVPVIVKPAKSDTAIYDRAKQQMPHVDFTVTLALEG